MALTLKLLVTLELPVEVEAIQPAVVRDMTPEQIARISVHCGNATLPLGEFFHVTGSASEDLTIVWQGDCSRVKLIGSGMNGGSMRIEGDAGMHLGTGMIAGDIVCEGNATDWLGAEMRGGRIVVAGNAGNYAGSVYRGGNKGMTGGEILINGNAGDETGRAVRRGLIAIAGNCGDGAGYSMIAGTIIIAGQVGQRIAASMKRGTIVLLNTAAATVFDIPMNFRQSGCWQPQFLRLYLNSLRTNGFDTAAHCLTDNYLRMAGDMLELGKGEILFRLPSAA